MHNFLQDILKESNTIIIPGLGALTVTSSKTGDIYFMPFLKHDDGHLAKYVSTHEGVELNEAKQILSNFVEAIKTAIAEGDYFEMEEFGRFFTNKEGEIDFERWEDYQVKDNSILSKKIQERQQAQPKKVEKPAVELKKEKPKVDPSIEPITAPIVETISEPIIESFIESITEEEPISHQPIIEQKSIDELLGNSSEERVIPLESIITPIEEISEISETIQPTIEHHHKPTVEEIIEAQERDILIETDPTTAEEVTETKTVITENKNTVRKKLKKEEKAEEKRRQKAAKLEAKELAKATPKEKKKSRSIILWLFSAIAITAGVMWYIKTQRENEVHLTVIDKKESKVVTSKVVEKEDLHKEIEKHKGVTSNEVTKAKEVKKVKEVKKIEKKIIKKEEKKEVKKEEKKEKVIKTSPKKSEAKTKVEKPVVTKPIIAKKAEVKVPTKEKPTPKVEVKEKPVAKPTVSPVKVEKPMLVNTKPVVSKENKPTTTATTPASKKETNTTPIAKPTVTSTTPSAKGTTPAPASKPTVTSTTPAAKGTTPTPVAKPTVTSTTPAAKGTTPTPAAKPIATSTTPAAKGTTPTPTAKPTVTSTTPGAKGTTQTPVAKPTATPKPVPAGSNAGYTSPNKNIQVIVGTFKDKSSADQFVSDLKGKGFSTAYSKEDNGQFSVSLGSFSTLSESSKALQKYKSGK